MRPAELRLVLAPRATYAVLARLPAHGSVWLAIRRPLLVAAVLGASMAISATGGVTPSLLVSTTICWSLVVLLQVAIALAVIIGSPRTIGLPRALDLYFASHAPWSMWLLVMAAWGPSPLGRSLWPVLAAAVLPITLTPIMVAAFFREVLGMNRRRAMARAVVQQAITWSLFVGLFGAAVQLWPRLLQWVS